jgi:hypothetical protein
VTDQVETMQWRAATTWLGRAASVFGLVVWSAWIAWQLTQPVHGPVGVATILLELVALAVAAVVTAALWSLEPTPTFGRQYAYGERPTVPEVMAVLLSVDPALVDVTGEIAAPVGADDTGEVAWARRGMSVLRGRAGARRSVRDAAWSFVALDGLRRALCLGLLTAVLFSGSAPFDLPPTDWLLLLGVGVLAVSTGHWLLSGGRMRPGARLVWSMASVGAGLGSGVSRTTLPIRWVATMASIVVLNLAISLRGLSDRWTHGLDAMPHDVRVVAMSVAFGFVGTGLIALRTLPKPELDFYGATRRLEEASTRRLTLGATVGIALVGFAAGVAPTTTF